MILSSSDMPHDEIQVCMYSATFPGEVKDLASQFLSDAYVHVSVIAYIISWVGLMSQVGQLSAATPDITQRIIWVESNDKLKVLQKMLLEQPPSAYL